MAAPRHLDRLHLLTPLDCHLLKPQGFTQAGHKCTRTVGVSQTYLVLACGEQELRSTCR